MKRVLTCAVSVSLGVLVSLAALLGEARASVFILDPHILTGQISGLTGIHLSNGVVLMRDTLGESQIDLVFPVTFTQINGKGPATYISMIQVPRGYSQTFTILSDFGDPSLSLMLNDPGDLPSGQDFADTFTNLPMGVTEDAIMGDLASVNNGGTQTSNLDAYVNDYSGQLGVITVGGMYSDGGYFGFSTEKRIGTVTAFEDPSTVPEPASWLLLSLGGLGLAGYAWRRRKQVV
jgi:hypothetical protein